MSELKTEEEQIEAFKAWWKKNGTTLVIVIAVAAAGYFGWQAWKTNQENHLSEASALYQNLVEAAANLEDENNQKTVSYIAQQLSENYSDTGYAMFGQLFLARVDVEQGNYDAAIAALKLAATQTEDASFVAIANLRIARLLLQQGNYQAAMDHAQQVTQAEYLAQQQEVIGDIFLQQNMRDEARTAYEKASEALGTGVNHPLLDIKLQDLVKG
ncbi:tetratricopeptide repeat protein [Marinomonas sp. THO17]|uniref:YfgM family protein n=1 Tax=Marinomonas sp. THO17 TaxID=3149048 RepID=UPI00336BCE81